MSAYAIKHDSPKIPRFGSPEVLADGTSGRQMLGFEIKRTLIISWATADEIKTYLETYFPGGVGDFQMDGDYDPVPVVDQITNLFNVRVTGSKHTAS